ncbi:MAG: Ig-like domain-containing protein [Gammaproteobacteria bacterium]|nr:Ig-like domain-containing protein [Gammaproteobacteria bacterium]MBQ0774843.1 Ig-like domain-containing protein [Gammaproteobacteria bacterium]
MKFQYTALLSIVALISACGGDKQTVAFDWETADLVYSFPYDGQPQVAMTAPIVLRFAQPLAYADQAELDADIATKVVLESAASPGIPIAYNAKMVDSNLGLVLTPVEKLLPATDYSVTLNSLETTKGVVAFPGAPIDFRTRAATKGAKSVRVQDDVFSVSRVVPNGDVFPIMDFSSLRVQLTQPVQAASVRYGDDMNDTVRITDADGALVDALLIAQDSFLTIDPIDDLEADGAYTLTIDGLESEYNELLAPWDLDFVAQNSAPREILVQRAATSSEIEADQCGSNPGVILSPLTGDAINCVPVKSTLLGQDSASQQQGDVYAELAFIPHYPVVSPLRVPRGSLLEGASVELVIAGKVPAGFSTDKISVSFISDAVGYLLPNSYSKSETAPRHVRLLMDVAMTAEDSRANGGLSQDLMHIELSGIALVINGLLTIDAVGVVEPSVLGVDEAFGVLSFHMEAYGDQLNAPPMQPDVDAPMLQSWVPGANVAKQSSENPIILHFSEALDPLTVRKTDAVILSKDGIVVPTNDWALSYDGASIVIRPDAGLAYKSVYEVQLSAEISDLGGNALSSGGPLPANYTLQFEMPNYIAGPLRSPLALTTYPGFPCVTTDRALALGDHGICDGGLATDDHLPVPTLPSDRAITVQFSQDMDEDSIVLGGSFRVERQNGAVWEAVPGRLQQSLRSLIFWSDEPWQDDGSQLYRYVLGSLGAAGGSAKNCDGSLSICDVNGSPLQTKILAQNPGDAPAAAEGGPNMEIYFVGAPAAVSVFQPARNLPATDLNGNQLHDGRTDTDYDADTQSYPGCDALPASCEELPIFDVASSEYITPPNSTKIVENGVDGGNSLLTAANVGCGFTGNLFSGYTPRVCPDRKFVYLTGALNVELVGPIIYPPTGEEAVQVNVLPTQLMTSSLDFYAIAVLLGEQFAPTGPMIMRVRYSCDDPLDAACTDPNSVADQVDRNQAVVGYLLDGPSGPEFEVTFDLYLDAPSLNPLNFGSGGTHNQHSFPLQFTLRGPVSFLDDGRMEIEQTNADPIDLAVEVFGDTINVVIPAGGVNLNYTTAPSKQ